MASFDRSRIELFAALRRRLHTSRAVSVVVLVVALPVGTWAAQSLEARYPYDPACPWGRLSNGKGMLHRCLTEAEAVALASGAGSPQDCKGSPGCEKAPAKVPEGPEAPKGSDFDLQVGPIVADQGDITLGRLGAPLDRYRECVEKGGGPQRDEARVVVKFLVRGERLRAEGASVESFDGVSEEVAKCLAYVVDRRKVGSPSVPLTGAHLTFQLRAKK